MLTKNTSMDNGQDPLDHNATTPLKIVSSSSYSSVEVCMMGKAFAGI